MSRIKFNIEILNKKASIFANLVNPWSLHIYNNSQKINSFIDQKTAWINKLDKINIAKNNAAGVIPPEDTAGGIAGAISGVIGSKLQQATPLISLVATKLTSGSLGGSSGGGGGLGGLLSGGLA